MSNKSQKRSEYIKKNWPALILFAVILFLTVRSVDWSRVKNDAEEFGGQVGDIYASEMENYDPENTSETSNTGNQIDSIYESQNGASGSIVNNQGETVTGQDFGDAIQRAQIADQLLQLEFTGVPAVSYNNNEPLFSEAEKMQFITDYDSTGWPIVSSYESYSELDAYGRPGVAFACIGADIMPAEDEERGSISSIYPPGWAQAQYPGYIDRSNGYFYERCHLIAWSLAGENANEKNLITGTGYFNVDGMYQVCEEPTLSYLKENPENHVLYRVTPVYQGYELVARGVLIEAYSVEDGGAFQFCYYCFNVAGTDDDGNIIPIEIDYATGESYIK